MRTRPGREHEPASSPRERWETLAQLVEELPSTFACGGSFTPARPITLRSGGAVATFTRDAPAASLAPLLERAKPASFGHGRGTRQDPAVRDGWQLSAERDSVSLEHFDPDVAGVTRAVCDALASGTELEASLYSVNVYREGGHFRPHKDTPRTPDVVGTLVVCLPSPFAGGSLVVRHGGWVRRFDWARQVAAQHSTATVHWAAFYGDVDHEIERVSAGTRVTLTYLLRPGPPRPAPSVHGALSSGLASALDDPTFAPRGARLVFPCVHLYARGDASPTREPLTSASLDWLKGRDAAIARAAFDNSLEGSLVYRLGFRDDEGASDIAAMARARPLSDHELADARRALAKAANHDADVSPVKILEGEALLGHEGDEDGLERIVVSPPDRAREHLFKAFYSPTEYYGNEASFGSYFVFAALELLVPPAALRSLRRGVTHPTFGPGMVVGQSGEGDTLALRVRFADGSERVVLRRFLREA